MVESSVLLKFSFLPNYSKINTYLLMETAVKSQQILYCTEIILKELPQNYSKVHLETQIFLKKGVIMREVTSYCSDLHTHPWDTEIPHSTEVRIYSSKKRT